LKTTVLPDGSIVPLVKIRCVRTKKHFFSDKFYVEFELKNGRTQNIAERVSHRDADAVRQELIDAIQLAYSELSPFNYGYQEGHTDGHLEGRASGLEEGRTEGYQEGYPNGRSEGYNHGHSDGYELGLCEGRSQGSADERARILEQVGDMRDALVQEQRWGELVEPSRRRYLGHAVRALTDVIQALTPEPPMSPED
jgi:flagellar biosynthesis/type III secretory pathway protein FliH